MATENSNIRREVNKGALILNRVYKSDFQKKGTLTAELKQTVTVKSFYPSKRVSNSLQDNIFGTSDFGFEEKEFESTETRVAWIDVPENATMETVQAQLAKFPNANLYRILSNKPIIADSEQAAINNANFDVTLDTFADRQVVRYPEGSDNAGELALHNGKPQYRRIAFSATGSDDIDQRTADSSYYASAEIAAELNGNSTVLTSEQFGSAITN